MEISSAGAPSMSHRVRATWLLLLCSGLLLLPADAFAQMRSQSKLLRFNATYASGKHELADAVLDGWGVSAALEWSRRNYSLGFALGWISFNEIPAAETPPATPENPEPQVTGIDVNPVYITGKYFLGSDKARFYLGGGLGVYTSRQRSCSPVICNTAVTGGTALAVPLGLYVFPSEAFFFNVGYVFNWLSNSVLKNNIAHVINLGVGFQIGS